VNRKAALCGRIRGRRVAPTDSSRTSEPKEELDEISMRKQKARGIKAKCHSRAKDVSRSRSEREGIRISLPSCAAPFNKRPL